ncbi:hypothetical protein ABIE61_003236 [Marinobacterium sp. MBR-111]|jgi:hypothetical protein|uniref:cache domain-containing protein n=1 Tax=Marinobacterium sp. MBR-111 TaxID=3156463 RepID=UPI00339A966C
MSVEHVQQSCLDGIARAVSEVFERLEQIEQAVQQIFHRSTATGEGLMAKDFRVLRPLLDHHLNLTRTTLQGTGVVLEPGLLTDTEMHVEWRQISTNGHIVPLNLNFNRSSDYYYNYLDMAWFSQPRKQGRRMIAGPYVDLYGQDMYLLTFSLPIHIDGRFVGIAGADVALSRFESVLMRSLLHIGNDAMLVSEQGRVIAANNANYSAGELARQALNSPQIQRQILDLGHEGVHWSLLQSPHSSHHQSMVF